jgi:DNA-binding response OmpR family regulator
MNIVVLEEQSDVGEMLRHGLELAGHSVVVYSSPAPLLAALSAPAPVPVDCLIVALPLTEGISGEECVQRLRKTFPALPVILIMDGSSWEVESARRISPGIEVLRKPFKLATLLSLLKKLSS